MANKRASLSSHDLSEFHVPLSPGNEHREPVEAPDDAVAPSTRRSAPRSAAGAEPYPSLARGRREEMVSRTLRIPLSMATALDEVMASSGVAFSELVRDFITRCLRDIGKGQ